MPIVYQQVATQRASSVIVYTASTVGDIPHNQSICARAESRQNIRDERGEQKEAFRELESDVRGASGADPVDGFVDLEVVVCREVGDCGCDVGVLEDGGGDLVEGSGRSGGLGCCVMCQFIFINQGVRIWADIGVPSMFHLHLVVVDHSLLLVRLLLVVR